MSEQVTDPSPEPAGAAPPASKPPTEKRHRRTALSTGFSDVPGTSCQVCGYQGFRWQTTCPQGHPLA